MMNDEEIRMRNRDMSPSQDRVGILAELNACTRPMIREALGFQSEEAPDKSSLYQYYNKGMTDREIADAAGCFIKVVQSWRDQNNLLPNASRKLFDTDKAKRLYDCGAHDPIIAMAVGVEKHIIQRWRKKHGLSPNFGKKAMSEARR